jgi:hypothetical protein
VQKDNDAAYARSLANRLHDHVGEGVAHQIQQEERDRRLAERLMREEDEQLARQVARGRGRREQERFVPVDSYQQFDQFGYGDAHFGQGYPEQFAPFTVSLPGKGLMKKVKGALKPKQGSKGKKK